MPTSSHEFLTIASDDLTVQVDPLGAQLSVLRDVAGRDLLWDGNPTVWAGRAPLLFPIVGMLAGGHYRLGTDFYDLPRHGFARGKVFSVARHGAAGVTFELSADASTLAVYPFHFFLSVEFELSGRTLTVTASIRNRGDGAMPASFGYHPALRWPLPYERSRSAHFIEFEVDEPAPVRRLDSSGLLMPQGETTPVVRRRLTLTDELFSNDVVIFDQLRSRYATYGAEDGPRIRLDFPDAAYLGIWSKPGARFICIEPWHGVTDSEGFAGDFRVKPGIFSVPPGGVFSTTMAMTWFEGA